MILPFVCLSDVCFIFLKGYSRSTSSTLAYLRALPQCHYDFNYLSRWTAKVHHMGRALTASGQQAAVVSRQKMSSLKLMCKLEKMVTNLLYSYTLQHPPFSFIKEHAERGRSRGSNTITIRAKKGSSRLHNSVRASVGSSTFFEAFMTQV